MAPTVADAARYTASSDKFTCFDGSASIAITSVNDDFCDCKDGSDEPGVCVCACVRACGCVCLCVRVRVSVCVCV